MGCPGQPDANYCDGTGDCVDHPDWCCCPEGQQICADNGYEVSDCESKEEEVGSASEDKEMDPIHQSKADNRNKKRDSPKNRQEAGQKPHKGIPRARMPGAREHVAPPGSPPPPNRTFSEPMQLASEGSATAVSSDSNMGMAKNVAMGGAVVMAVAVVAVMTFRKAPKKPGSEFIE